MNSLAVLAAVAGTLLVVVFAEVVAAVLPLVIVLTFVPHEERADLARLLASCDSSRRLRLWSALRTAVKARQRDRDRKPALDPETAFHLARGLGLPVNQAHGRDPAYDRPPANRP
jgi:hypothetical protein